MAARMAGCMAGCMGAAALTSLSCMLLCVPAGACCRPFCPCSALPLPPLHHKCLHSPPHLLQLFSFVPSRNLPPLATSPAGLLPSLRTYQSRAVAWMLQRERGAQGGCSGEVETGGRWGGGEGGEGGEGGAVQGGQRGGWCHAEQEQQGWWRAEQHPLWRRVVAGTASDPISQPTHSSTAPAATLLYNPFLGTFVRLSLGASCARPGRQPQEEEAWSSVSPSSVNPGSVNPGSVNPGPVNPGSVSQGPVSAGWGSGVCGWVGAVAGAVRGGIVAEEMGLGKTVEVLACILSHRWGGSGGERQGEEAEKGVLQGEWVRTGKRGREEVEEEEVVWKKREVLTGVQGVVERRGGWVRGEIEEGVEERRRSSRRRSGSSAGSSSGISLCTAGSGAEALAVQEARGGAEAAGGGQAEQQREAMEGPLEGVTWCKGQRTRREEMRGKGRMTGGGGSGDFGVAGREEEEEDKKSRKRKRGRGGCDGTAAESSRGRGGGGQVGGKGGREVAGEGSEGCELRECGSTLIVCPAAILPQWQQEAVRHTRPHTVAVLVYRGVNSPALRLSFRPARTSLSHAPLTAPPQAVPLERDQSPSTFLTSSPATPLTSSPATPLTSSPATPLTSSPATPLTSSPATPLTSSPASPPVASPDSPLTFEAPQKPSTPHTASPASPPVASSDSPLTASSATAGRVGECGGGEGMAGDGGRGGGGEDGDGKRRVDGGISEGKGGEGGEGKCGDDSGWRDGERVCAGGRQAAQERGGRQVSVASGDGETGPLEGGLGWGGDGGERDRGVVGGGGELEAVWEEVAVVTVDDLAAADIVLTSYDTLRGDIWHDVGGQGHVATRQLRYEKRYQIRPTPLTQLHWWRVCLDEAQLVEGGTSRAAVMAARLSARLRWCVSGTPLHRGLPDLLGLLRFLRASPFDDPHWWRHFFQLPVQNGCGAAWQELLALMSQLMWRHHKADVADELALPPQRQLLTVLQFSAIEAHFYRQQHAKPLGSQGRPMHMDEVLQVSCVRQVRCGAAEKARVEAEEAQRLLISALNGLAALAAIHAPALPLRSSSAPPASSSSSHSRSSSFDKSSEQWQAGVVQAVGIYRDVLRLMDGDGPGDEGEMSQGDADVDGDGGEEGREKGLSVARPPVQGGVLRTDPLQRLHVLHNLHELLALLHATRSGEGTREGEQGCSAVEPSGDGAGLGVARTLRDERLEAEGGEVKERYLVPLRARAAAAQKAFEDTHSQASGGDGNKEAHGRRTCEKHRGSAGDECCMHCKTQEFFESYQRRLFHLRLSSTAPSLPASSPSDHPHPPNPPSSPHDPLHVLHSTLGVRRTPLTGATAGGQGGRGRGSRGEGSGGAGNVGEKGGMVVWNPSDTERCLAVLASVLRSLPRGIIPEDEQASLAAAASSSLEALEAMRKEFLVARAWSEAQRGVLRALDELHMAVTRITLRHVDEPPSATSAAAARMARVSEEEVAALSVVLTHDRLAAAGQLQISRAQLSELSVLPCGHLLCCKCTCLLVERSPQATSTASGGTMRERRMRCPTCRHVARASEIAYVDNRRDHHGYPAAALQADANESTGAERLDAVGSGQQRYGPCRCGSTVSSASPEAGGALLEVSLEARGCYCRSNSSGGGGAGREGEEQELPYEVRMQEEHMSLHTGFGTKVKKIWFRCFVLSHCCCF
ncbi:unnamed protein product [Closterium sp. Yama58-4]|nr:unnamed protein product [Closterium sp. Yama58-4]